MTENKMPVSGPEMEKHVARDAPQHEVRKTEASEVKTSREKDVTIGEPQDLMSEETIDATFRKGRMPPETDMDLEESDDDRAQDPIDGTPPRT